MHESVCTPRHPVEGSKAVQPHAETAEGPCGRSNDSPDTQESSSERPVCGSSNGTPKPPRGRCQVNRGSRATSWDVVSDHGLVDVRGVFLALTLERLAFAERR